jgi:hypothetical protein
MVAWFDAADLYVAFATKHRFLKSERDALADVLPSARLIGGATSAPEEGVKDVSEAAKGVKAIERAIAAAVHAGVAKTVVPRPLFLIA